jgi:Ca2+-binding RTX toxin-like protein
MDGTTQVAGTFSYAYYVGSGTGGMSLGSTPPTNADTYTVVATFTSTDPDYSSGGTAQTTFTIKRAPISHTIGNDTQAYGYPANLAADLPSSFPTGVNGESLDISYSSNGDTSTAKPGTYDITGMVSNGSGLAANYCVNFTDGTLTVLGPGVAVVGTTQLWIVGGTTTNDHVQVSPVGSSTTGSTGVQVQATLNGVSTSTPYSQSFSALYIFLYGGNDNVQLANTLTIATVVSAGNGNDNIQAGNGSNAITAGNGNDNAQLGDGNNTVVLGNGNDYIQVGNGNNVIVEGAGNDNVQAGNGDNLIVGGLGKHTIHVGSGANILIDGSVNLNIGALDLLLAQWVSDPVYSPAIQMALQGAVTDNTTNPNTLQGGTGLDWFWETYAKDHVSGTGGELLN